MLITGAAGFLGSYLCERFVRENFHVTGMDNLLTGALKNIAHLLGNKNFDFCKYDVTNYVHISDPLDYILHFASPASPNDYLRMPIQTLKVGSLGTHNLLGLAKDKGARILVASTSEVYGDPKEHPQQETYWGNVNPVGPRGVYDEAKRFMESMTMAYKHFHRVDTGIVRIFNTFGPRMRKDDGRALPTFMSQAMNGEALTVYGDGRQTRTFCYVDDVVEGICRLLQSDHSLPVNIGGTEEITIKQLAEEIISLTGSESEIKYLPLPEDDPAKRKPDISKAGKLLDWRPEIPFIEGLKRTIEYQKTHL